MKRILLSTLVLMSVSAIANANNPYYASFKVGVADTKLKSDKIDGVYPFDNQQAVILDQNSFNTSTSVSNDSKNTIPLSFAVGYDFSETYNFDVRAELEYTYTANKKFKTNTANTVDTNFGVFSQNPSSYENKINTNTIMANVYYDFKNSTDFTPFISGGLGLTHLKSKVSALSANEPTTSNSDDSFSWSVGAGVSYALSQSTSLELAYKYVDLGKFTNNQSSIGTTYDANGEVVQKLDGKTSQDLKLHSNQLSFGVRHKF